MRLGLLGAGGISVEVARAIHAGRVAGVVVVAVAGSAPGSASAMRLGRQLEVPAVTPAAFVELGCDWVLEAAGADAVRSHLPRLWSAGVSSIVMSVGAMIDPAVEAAWRDATARGVRVVLPSGSIAGLDGVRALAAGGGLRRVSLATTKPPAGLRGAPYLERHGIELPDDRAVNFFEGTARAAVTGFPANVNVAVALSLAGLGPDATRVTIRSDPASPGNRHLIVAEADAARLEVRIESAPSADNPRTSRLAAASAVAAIVEAAAAS
jgi:aspartate dehydrogenase